MRKPITPSLFAGNRANLVRLLAPNSLAIVNANDLLPTNADGTLRMQPNSDLFYLTGIEQEETILLLAPNAYDEKFREVLEKGTRKDTVVVDLVRITDNPNAFQGEYYGICW